MIKSVYRVELEAIVTMLRTTVTSSEFNILYWENSKACTRCAIGHAVAQGILSGLKVTPVRFGISLRLASADEKYRNWDAVQVALGLTYYEAGYLFSYTTYKSKRDWHDPLAVANRIEAFLATKRWPEEVADAGEERFMAECRAVAVEPIVALEEVAT